MGVEHRARLSLTRPGWAALAVALAAGIAGRVTAIGEFSLAAAIAAGFVVAAAILTRTAGRALTVSRSISRRRINVGDTSLSELRCSTSLPQLRLPMSIVDHVDATATTPRTMITPRGSGYRIMLARQGERRGVLRFGPLAVSLLDPLGLVRCTIVVPDPATVVVLPRLVPLAVSSQRLTAGDGHQVRDHQRRWSVAGDEFDALREYVPGDDIRLVHWPSTARTGVPVVRQFEPTPIARCTVWLVTSPPHNDGIDTDAFETDAFERAVSAAASVLALCLESGETVRFVLGDELVGTTALRTDDLDSLLDRLAAATPTTTPPLDAAALRRAGFTDRGDRLVICVAGLHDAVAAVARHEHSQGGEVVVIDCGSSQRHNPPATTNTGATVVSFDEHSSLRTQWNNATTLSGQRT